MMHGHEKSRSAIVAVKPTNKAERTAAEPVERRAETKGNADQQRTRRTQRRISVSKILARIRQQIVPAIMVHRSDEIDEAFAAMNKEGARAVVVQGSLLSKNTAELALKHRLPAVSVPRSFPEMGGLMSYGLDGPDSFRRCAMFVIRILQGGKPADMPVEQPTKFELVINLKTANALGITVPLPLVGRADDVIE